MQARVRHLNTSLKGTTWEKTNRSHHPGSIGSIVKSTFLKFDICIISPQWKAQDKRYTGSKIKCNLKIKQASAESHNNNMLSSQYSHDEEKRKIQDGQNFTIKIQTRDQYSLNVILGGGISEAQPPSGFSSAIAKRLEIASWNVLNFNGHSLPTFCEFFGARSCQVRSADPPSIKFATTPWLQFT